MTDGLDCLRIPYEKIKFGKKLEVQGYGTVFEGEFDGQRVVLKQPNITNLGNVRRKLLAEILTVSRFRHHPNLVALLGFCDEKSNEITLVYEYVSGGNLADKMRKRLTTIQRLEICLGAARGLDYLHTGFGVSTPGIVHGDIKLSKVLLHSDLISSKVEAKVSSFGLSRQIIESTDEVIEGPTKKSDVYSFGVLLLEVLCGVPELIDTDDYQRRHVTKLELHNILHFDVKKEIKTDSLETYATIACRCVLENPEERPCMAQVVKELEKALVLQEGGEVSDVQIVGSVDGAPVIAPQEDGNVVMVESELVAAGEDDAGETDEINDQPQELHPKIKEVDHSEQAHQLRDVMMANAAKVARASDKLYVVKDELSNLRAQQVENEELIERLCQKLQEKDYLITYLYGVLSDMMSDDSENIETINWLRRQLDMMRDV